MARAIVEGTVASQGRDARRARGGGVHSRRLLVIGGAAKNPAVQRVLAELVDLPLGVPTADEYVAKGAAMQAAAALTGSFPLWSVETSPVAPAPPAPQIVRQHHDAQIALGHLASAPAPAPARV